MDFVFFVAVFTDAAVFGDTNLELPSFRSNQSVVEIHMNIASKVLSRYEDDLEVNLEIPLHARYPVSDLDKVEFSSIKQCLHNSASLLYIGI